MGTPNSLSGFRDFLSDKALQRRRLIGIISSVYESFGFAPLETPAMESLDTLAGKYGEEGDKLIFKIMKRGGDLQRALDQRIDRLDPNRDPNNLADMAMRYDLTVPLARVIAQYREEIKLPYKRYQIAPVWRAERASEGRFREFYQCDIDTVGSADILADAEIAMIISELLGALGFSNFEIRINNRNILDGLIETCGISASLANNALRALDKLEKIGSERVIAEMVEDGISKEAAENFMNIIGQANEARTVADAIEKLATVRETQSGAEGLDEITDLFEAIAPTKATEKARFDISIARGLDYYTGTVYETTLLDAPSFGSVMSGGRFDKLIGRFIDRDIPAVGASLGLDRLFAAMEKLGLLLDDSRKTNAEYYIATMEKECWAYAMEIAEMVRKSGRGVYISPSSGKIRDQLGAASNLGVDRVLIIGSQELEARQITVKDMTTREQKIVPFDKLF